MTIRFYNAVFVTALCFVTNLSASDVAANNFEELPTEINHKILIELHYRELAPLERVSKNFQAIIQDISFIKAMVAKHYPCDINYLLWGDHIEDRLIEHHKLIALSFKEPRNYYNPLDDSSLLKVPTILHDSWPLLVSNTIKNNQKNMSLRAVKGDSIEFTKLILIDYKKKHRQRAYKFNHVAACSGNAQAISRELTGHITGTYGYPIDRKKSLKILELIVIEGSSTAINCIMFNQNIHNPQNKISFKSEELMALKKAIDNLAEQGNSNAYGWQVKGIAQGLFGFTKDLEQAKALNEKYCQAGDEGAIHRRINSKYKKELGYDNPNEAIHENQDLINQADLPALRREIMWFERQYSPTHKNWSQELRKTAIIYNEQLIAMGDHEAMQWKAMGLLNGNFLYNKDPSLDNDADQQPDLFGEFMESLKTMNPSIHIKYLIQCYMFGLGHFKQDHEKAAALIKKYNTTMFIAKGEPWDIKGLRRLGQKIAQLDKDADNT